MSEPSLAKRVARGAQWTSGLAMADNGIAVLGNFILARLLVPDDFGVIAIATAFTALLDTFTNFGFRHVLIRERSAEDDFYDAAWTLSTFRGLALAAILVVSAGPIAGFFNEPRMVAVVRWLAIGSALVGLVNPKTVVFEKQLDFRVIFFWRLGSRSAGLITSVICALLFRSYWAIVCGTLAYQLADLALSYAIIPYRPRISFRQVRRLLGFSVWLLLNNLLTALSLHGNSFIIRKFATSAALGIFNMGYSIAMIPNTRITQSLTRVLFPALTTLQHKAEELGRAYSLGASAICLMMMPCSIGIALVSHDLVVVCLGLKWLEAIPILQGMALAFGIRLLSVGSVALYMAEGRFYLLPVRTLIEAATGLLVTFLLIEQHGVMAAVYGAWVATGSTLIFTIVANAGSVAGYGRILLASIVRTLLSSAAMTAAVMVSQDVHGASTQPVRASLGLAIDASLGAAVYGLAHLALWRLTGLPDGAEERLLALIPARFRNRIHGILRVSAPPGE